MAGYKRMLSCMPFLLLILASTAMGKLESPHGDFKIDCESCHSTESWQKMKADAEFDHAKTGFPLTGNHSRLDCRQCHESLKFSHTGTECADCHTDVHRGQFGIDCSNCHTPVDWTDHQDILGTHSERGFPLVGVHAVADCEACHVGFGRDEFAGTPSECSGCHVETFNGTDNPDHSLARFSLNCEECHLPVSRSWTEAMFEHPETFALIGAHAQAECEGCHSETFAGTPTVCYPCHETNYTSSTNPAHEMLGFPVECELCHAVTQWEDGIFDHVEASGFELRQAHALLQCNDCHVQNQFDLPRECFGCHEPDYNTVADPPHASSNFPTDCTMCHTETSWSPASFDHSLTDFPLTGAHQTITCDLCHVNGQYAGTPTDCWSCHQQDYEGVDDPNHVANNFDQDCTVCHSTAAWEPSTFNHALTDFPLTGAHVSLNCTECHADGYAGTPSDCWSCHQSDYEGVDDPSHVAGNYDHDCTVCHTTSDWDAENFNHAMTDFQLTGAHAALDCMSCHATGYNGTPTDCWPCHETDYQGVSDPDHVANNFDQDCTLCHGTTAWTPSTFDHAMTEFPLTGQHVTLNCIECHADGYSGTPTDCWSCHQSDYEGANDPDHVANNFDQDCTICHSTNGWEPADFDHSATDFPLTGAHLTLNCLDCHADGYSGTPTDCWSCHQSDYEAVDDPDHVVGNYDHDCTVCHTTDDWEAENFDHSSTDFPLTGAHVTVNCIECHATGYSGTPIDCVACHEDDYNSVPDPNHQAAGFPTDCTLCHNTNDWEQTTFNHDGQYFPIYSGRHQGEWNLCADCHVNSNNYGEFECIFCHEHNQPDTDDRHVGVSGYEYTSDMCYFCHPTGEAED